MAPSPSRIPGRRVQVTADWAYSAGPFRRTRHWHNAPATIHNIPWCHSSPVSIGKIPPSPEFVSLYFNDSTGEGEGGGVDVTGPWNKRNGIKVAGALAFKELRLAGSSGKNTK
jgi:hypothetical protein